ncbi:MAG: hypothetical protein P4L41_10675 [Flavipsychrobacter sp.]|nr:hypothetical protein [Flavipsychrobacter sp.]
MDLRILMISDDPCYIIADVQLLRDKGFRIYTCFNFENISDLIREINPHVVFFNLKQHSSILDSYHNKPDLSNMAYTSSVVYSIDEDGSYMIVPHGNEANKKRLILSDNIITAVKTALRYSYKASNAILPYIRQAQHMHTVGA